MDKLTLDEYIEKYSKPVNNEKATKILKLVIVVAGVILFTLLTLLVLKVFDYNQYVGYASIVVALAVFIFLFVVPVLKINSYKAFMTNVDQSNAKLAKKYNKQLRAEIADKMIELSDECENLWYDEAKIAKLAIARNRGKSEEIKNILGEIYNVDCRKAQNKLISEYAFKVGFTTAISQSALIDSSLILIYELALIKKIVYLYGYRPSDAKLMKIYKQVLVDVLVAYGASEAASAVVTKGITAAVDKIPFLGTIIASATTGVINSCLTVSVGYTTVKYLKKEYKLQDMLDSIELVDEESDEEELMNEVKEQFTKKPKTKQSAE